MQLLKFIEKETTESYRQVLLIATISGLANGLLLVIINHVTEAVAKNEDLTQYFILYMIAFSLFLYAQWYAFERAIKIIENAIYNTKMRLIGKIQQVELVFMEKIGVNTLYGRLTQNDMLVSQAIPRIVSGFQVFTLMVFSFIYLGYLSPLSFIITMIFLAAGVMYFLAHSRFIKKSLEKVKQKEKIYFQLISHLINGFKEVKINQNKGNDLLKDITNLSTEAQSIKTSIRKPEARLWGFGRLFIYALLPIVIFIIIPNFSHEHIVNIAKISSTLLFLIGPTSILVSTIPMVSRVNLAIEDLFSLEKEMDATIAQADDTKVNTTDLTHFKTITLNNISFSYSNSNTNTISNSDDEFLIGPLSEQINKGELLFVIGSNGSGKSTFLKLLTGLYLPKKGSLSVDNVLIDPSHSVAYRNLFSIVFSDYHLFDKFYGISNLNEEKVNYWLKKMQMQHKVSYQKGSFSSTNLSTGQRKRLAFIVAMLEDKPILVIDEFAADQDPQFRQYFYETLLGEIKAMGKTIVAVTHDEHYFHIADRVLKI